ncbi:MAG: radical SAM protein [Treponema sp.]|nr:radical SAM protein [Treponema sp.]
MLDLYKSCKLCPRNCGINRLKGEIGYCGETPDLRIGAAVIHKGEEPPLTGKGGSGTIFISGCNLGCAFCQNYQLSKGGQVSQTSLGRTVSPEEFAKICVLLEKNGAENINIVTGSHAVPGIIEGFKEAKKQGLSLPILWNSSGYDSREALELLSDYIDIYLPDLKTLDSALAQKFFNAPDYPETAKAAILKMLGILEKKSLHDAREKIIIRHLVLPGFLESTRSVLKWFADNIKDRALLSLMTQYTPIPNREREMPNRYLTEKEYKNVLKWLEEFEINDGFCQELVTGSDWLPDFKLNNPFSSELSVPVWHFSTSRT